MKNIFFAVMLTFLTVSHLFGTPVEEKILEASNSLSKLLKNQNGIPMRIIEKAQAIVIIPGSIKFGLFIGAKYGEGVVSVKRSDGSWSYPFFVKMGDGSLGFQLGFELADTILVFTTQNSVKGLLGDKFTIGVGATASIGPLSADVDKSTEVDMSSEIFTYSQKSGIFAGASFNGTMLSLDEEKNRALYGSSINTQKILKEDDLSNVYGVKEFLKNINNLTR
jgi:lipid-binding SYLF domain-containing protein